MASPCHRIGHVTATALALAAATAGARFSRATDLPTIQHQPVRCLVAGKYPELDACFEPASRVALARVYFRGEGAGDWYYVEMKAETPCFRGVLPRPKKSLTFVSYYLAVTDRDFAEERTQEYTPRVVPDQKSCADGLAAPFLSSASVVVGGASALPAGFVGGGVLAGLATTTAVAGAAVVGAGTAGVVITRGGDEDAPASSPTTTTLATTTTLPTTTTTLPVNTTTTTTTTTLRGCGDDSRPPEVQILSPADGADVGGRVDIVVEASDPGPVSNGVQLVRVYAEEQGGSRSFPIATLGGPGPTFRTSWVTPACMGPQDRWYIRAEAVDGCDRSSLSSVRVRRRQASCAAQSSSSSEGAALVWTSELALPGGRGQLIANQADVVFPGAGRSDLALPKRPGQNRLEAVLVEGGAPGAWRFTLAAGAIRAGSLRVLAGEAVAVGPESVVFRLRGRSGERVVFAFDAE
jgi:hypothetical protein